MIWRSTRWGVCVVCLFAFLMSAKLQAADDPIGAMAPLVGQWRIDTKWKNNDTPLKSRIVMEWGPGKKFIIAHTYVTPNDGGAEYERYHDVFAAENGKLVHHVFSYDGVVAARSVELSGKTFKSRWTIPNSDPATTIRQEIEMAGNDRLLWRIWVEREGNSEQIMDGQWTRDGGPGK